MKQILHLHSVKDVTSNVLTSLENNPSWFEDAYLIRTVEESFLNLFETGHLTGTVHTCIGQELIPVVLKRCLQKGDWVTSNHRCHGHFIAKTGDWQGLIDEVLGLESGVCKGVGSSQHLFGEGFISNGIQGSLLPVGTGIAHSLAERRDGNIVVSFLGEGTLGEGVLYEALNLSQLSSCPQLFLCENNFYSQSTPQADGVAGQITERPKSFGIQTFEADIWDLENLFKILNEAVSYIRSHNKPAFVNIQCYRLMAHSKGDDDRCISEVKNFSEIDPLTIWSRLESTRQVSSAIDQTVSEYVHTKIKESNSCWDINEYIWISTPAPVSTKLKPIDNENKKLNKALSDAYKHLLRKGRTVFVGEDIKDPYGGAFKITKGFSTEFPDNVISTPISEAALVGFSIGKSFMGYQSYAEIMFGDFLTNACDQIVNNACKFQFMYADQAKIPIKIRVVSGGRRGYGPTHSQSLESMFIGREGLELFAITSLVDPTPFIISTLPETENPALVIENKVDYGHMLAQPLQGILFEQIGGHSGTVSIRPSAGKCDLGLIAYGGMARFIYDAYQEIFERLDIRIQIFCPIKIYPFPIAQIERSLRDLRGVVIVEEGIADGGWSATVLKSLYESNYKGKISTVGSRRVSVPSPRVMESQVLPSVDSIVEGALKVLT